MALNGKTALGDDQDWKREVEAELRSLSLAVATLTRIITQLQGGK